MKTCCKCGSILWDRREQNKEAVIQNTNLPCLLSERLFHQFIVNAFECIEQNRASYIRANQKTFRDDLFQGIEDAIVQGDTRVSAIG